jgi:2,4-dienoyl-CoA reductase-like NADH-dependent reductase (Old Yellow Enzyme family)
MTPDYKRIAALKTESELLAYLQENNIDLPFDSALETEPDSPLAQPLHVGNFKVGNRFTILPMEGWDGTPDGRPTNLTARRWQRFGLSGAKLIWGGEAVAVRHDGRANPNQLLISSDTLADLAALRNVLVTAHGQYMSTKDLLVGLQLTHSGRFARPNDKKRLDSCIAYDHPLLNPKFGLPLDSGKVVSDDWLDDLIADFVKAAVMAQEIGFDFVDLKHCHGYLGHELLSAVDRPGRYGGSFENRTRFLRELVSGIRRDAPGLEMGVRLSAFDFVPFQKGPDNVGVPAATYGPGEYRYAFGGDGTGLGIDLTESVAFLQLLEDLKIPMVCITGGSPYYVPHIQRPAYTPPSDGYLPPEDPLLGVARQIQVTRDLKARFPNLIVVGSAYTCLQDWLPNVAQAAVRQGWVDSVGLGRMVLSYPVMPTDILHGHPLQRKEICRTFSDCTTAPRGGLVSGCYPLDEYYKHMPEAKELARMKKG